MREWLPPATLQLGPLQMSWYAFWLVLSAALVLLHLRAGGAALGPLGPAALWCLVWGRAIHVLTHAEAFRGRPLSEWLQLDGISEHAALLAALALHAALGRRHPILAERWWVAVPLIAAGASIGCIPVGCGAGREVFWQTSGAHALAWQIRVDWPDPTLTRAPRLPTQLLTAGWSVLWLVALGMVLGREPRLRRYGPWLAALGFWLGELIIAPLRLTL